MEFSKSIRMTQPQTYNLDWMALGEWAISVVGILIAFFGFTNKWFKDRVDAREKYAQQQKQEKQDFIEKVVIATVSATLNSTLGGIKEDIATLFKYREDDRTHSDGQFRELMKEIRKP